MHTFDLRRTLGTKSSRGNSATRSADERQPDGRALNFLETRPMTTKADKLADVQAGAESLGLFLDAVEGPDRKTKGNGLRQTHYIPPFTIRAGNAQMAVCGAYVEAPEHSTEPTCPTCAAYLQQQDDMGDDPFGTPAPVSHSSTR